ncbi:MAG TPA: M1 family aminopeptidase [Anaerolineales bacterium]
MTQNPNASPTATAFQPAGSSETPPPTLTLAPSDIPPPTFTLVPPTATNAPLPDSPLPANPGVSGRTQYIFFASLDYAGHSVTADETIRYFNNTGQSLSEIVMAVEPNLWQNSFLLNSLEQDGAALSSYSLVGQRLSIQLAQPMAPGAAATFTLNFTLSLPPKRYEVTFGYLGYQVNLTDWYPFIVPFSGGWVLHDPWAFGEHLVYDSSDFEVNLKVNDPTVIVAASAPAEANGEWTRYRLYGARTFVLSASDRFLISESAVGAVVIRTYYFAGFEGAGDGMLHAAVQAVGLFVPKFGPYPYDSLSVVQLDVPDGQEYDGLVFLGTKFYDQYGGSARSNMVSIGVHEISHQWWFGLVGNDQALEPWLDEAMAVYSENIFYQFNYPAYGNWWWDFRVNYFGPAGWVDTSIYQVTTFRAYVNAAYLNGANFLYDLNVRMGNDDFYRFLKDYTSRYGRGRASGYDFFSVVRQNTSNDVSDLIQAYFQGSY